MSYTKWRRNPRKLLEQCPGTRFWDLRKESEKRDRKDRGRSGSDKGRKSEVQLPAQVPPADYDVHDLTALNRIFGETVGASERLATSQPSDPSPSDSASQVAGTRSSALETLIEKVTEAMDGQIAAL